MADSFYIPLVYLRHQWSKEYELGQGFNLAPFPPALAEAYREFDHGHYRKLYGDQLLKDIRSNYCLKVAWPIEPFKNTREMIYHIEDPAITLLIVLRIIKPTNAGFRTLFHVPAAIDPRQPFDFVDYRMQGFAMRRPEDIPAFEHDDVPNIVYYYAKLLELLKREYHHRRIFNALRFFDLGYRSENLDSRLIYFSIALEVLFKPLRGRISRGMTERIVAFLGTSPAEREVLTRTILAFIDLKARITHGDMTYFDITRPENVTLVRQQEDILRSVLQRILQRDKLIQIFSQIRERDAYFEQQLGPAPPVQRGQRGALPD